MLEILDEMLEEKRELELSKMKNALREKYAHIRKLTSKIDLKRLDIQFTNISKLWDNISPFQT